MVKTLGSLQKVKWGLYVSVMAVLGNINLTKG